MIQSAKPVPGAPGAYGTSVTNNLNLAIVVFFVLWFLTSLVLDHRRRRSDGSGQSALDSHLERALAASQLPTALMLLWAAFDQSILAHLSGFNIGFAVAAVVLGWVSIKTMLKR